MPTAPASPHSRRDKQLAKLKSRSEQLSKRREDMLDDTVSGCGYTYLAEKQKISATTWAPFDCRCLAVGAGHQKPANSLKNNARALSPRASR